ncbi:hypothetical protein BRLA_c020640 [Brevibacillus laterosporus LMG 15441]|uniref:Uncharacterized protein n=1 Tax=Brevibacillus laterosporus LMG 15441 TaxID=1042163 RepID=A0A075RA17_BRELA|nr:hypothetical protein BRLA_c020640 [Brevibacillus laterosporus LMG 15441]
MSSQSKKAKENRTTDTGCGSSFKTGFSGESSATEAGHRHYLPALRRKNVVLIQYHGLIQWRDHRLQYWRQARYYLGFRYVAATSTTGAMHVA